jgi:alpha-amylase/alpha-mannosidase (GH57 family)
MFDIGTRHDYFAHDTNSVLDQERLLHEIARELYRPAGEQLYAQARRNPTQQIVISMSGTALEMLERFDPITLRLYRSVAQLSSVVVRADTYYHSLAFWFSPAEHARQVHMHEAVVERLFGVQTQRHTPELVHSPVWLRSGIQQSALDDVYALEVPVLQSNDAELIEDWRRLQAIDHFRAMDMVEDENAEYAYESNSHTAQYVRAHGSPYETYISYKNALEDIAWRLEPQTHAESAFAESKPELQPLI